MHRSLFLSFCGFSVATSIAGAPPDNVVPKPDTFAFTVQPFLKKNCLGCHNDKARTGGLSLASAHGSADVIANRDVWERVSTRVKNGEMPPKGMPRPATNDIAAVSSWIDNTFEAIDRALPPDPGRLTAHRLNRFEYNNAIHDLLGISFKPAEDFPADDSGYGFDNIGDVLSLSPVLMEKYLSAAEKIARRVVAAGALPKPTRDKISASHIRKYPPDPIGEYIRYEVANEADYTIRAGVSGKREGLHVTLFVDALPVKDAIFDSADDELPRFIEFKTHLTAGEHRFGARLRREAVLAPMPRVPDLKFIRRKPQLSAKAEPPPPTPWVDYIEVRGPYDPLPAPPSLAQKRLYVCTSQTAACAGQILERLAHHAWRRPLSESELQKLVHFVAAAQANGDSFDEGIRLGIEAVLVSPNFLFRIERDPQLPAATHAITDSELASRLSFFLWSSVPDDELLHQAAERQLHHPAVLRTEVARMLKDPKSQRFVDNFAGQWLELRNLDSIQPDPDKFPLFGELRDDMRTETRMFFESMLRDNGSILDFIDGRYTYLNEPLAAFYGIPGVKGGDFRKVSLDGTERSGVLTQASVLTVSSYPTRTSPVIRGKWVLENFLNAPPPPPPPNVPALDASEVGAKVSLREQLEKHRANAVCASCHSKMDPLGFGLENYNAIGQWRTADGKFPIDSSGTLPNGKSFTTPEQMKSILKGDPRAFAQCLTEKMLTYALGRGLERYDRPAVKAIVDNLQGNDWRISNIVYGIVESLPFQNRRGEGDKHVTQTIAASRHP